MTSYILIMTFLALSLGEKIVVDLTRPPRTPESGEQRVFVRGGGILYHGNAPEFPPGKPTITLRLNRIVKNASNTSASGTVEVIATNVGKAPIAIPIGTDPVPLMNPAAEDRRYFAFTVFIGKNRPVGFAESASNAGHPDTSVTLRPGEEATFLLPIVVSDRDNAETEIRVSVQLSRKVMEKGTDWNESVGSPITSLNTLTLP